MTIALSLRLGLLSIVHELLAAGHTATQPSHQPALPDQYSVALQVCDFPVVTASQHGCSDLCVMSKSSGRGRRSASMSVDCLSTLLVC
jgi:hypothetical protein